ncbi:hypothetical protein ACFX1R_048753 [Malus domestica]
MPSLGDTTERTNDALEATDHSLTTAVSPDEDFWHLHVNGTSNFKGSEAGVVLVIPDGSMLEQATILRFKASNNEAEYETVLACLRMRKTWQ